MRNFSKCGQNRSFQSWNTHYSAISAYSKKNGWKLASPPGDRNGGILMGSLFGICGRILRDPEDECLVMGRNDDASPELDLDMFVSPVNSTPIDQ